MISITPTLALAESELVEEFIRAAGPGGQNVNKVATAVQLRFDARHSPALTADVRARLFRLAGKRATVDGVIVIHAARFRTQEQNRADARARLFALLRQATLPPKPRRATAPSRAAKAKRLEAKKRRGAIKTQRGRVRASE